MDCFTEAMLLLDVSEAGWKVLYANEAWESVTSVHTFCCDIPADPLHESHAAITLTSLLAAPS